MTAFMARNLSGDAGHTEAAINAERAISYDHNEKNGLMRAEFAQQCILAISSDHGTHGQCLQTQSVAPASSTPTQNATASYLGTDDTTPQLRRHP